MLVVDVMTTLYMAGFIAMVADGIATCNGQMLLPLYITDGTAKCDS